MLVLQWFSVYKLMASEHYDVGDANYASPTNNYAVNASAYGFYKLILLFVHFAAIGK